MHLNVKRELPLLFPDDSDVQIVGKAMMDPFEYFKARMKIIYLKPTSAPDLETFRIMYAISEYKCWSKN